MPQIWKPVTPTILLTTTSRWFPTARLGMALANAGCKVEALCPTLHPLRSAKSVGSAQVYSGLSPLASLARAIAITRPDLIVSGDDLATQHLHRLYAQELRNRQHDAGQREDSGTPGSISALIERSLGSADSFAVVSARAASMDLARQEGFRVPLTEVLRNIDGLKDWVRRMGLPAVLKADGTSGGDGVRIVRTLAEAERAFKQLQAPPLLARATKRALVDRDTTLVWPSLGRIRHVVNAQSLVMGHEATSTIFCWQGKVLASLHFEVVKKAASAGHATVVRLIECAEMTATVEGMVRRLGLSGFYGFDFMLEAGTGNAYLIEINPRATQVGHLSLGPGRDLPAALYSALTGAAAQPAAKVTEKDTIALFPQEWIRDPESSFLRTGYHDVPWEQPELVRDCVAARGKQSGWYSRRNQERHSSSLHAPKSAAVPAKSRAAGLD